MQYPLSLSQSLTHVSFFATPWTVASQAPLSMEFSRQEYRSGLQFPSPVDLPLSGTEPTSPALQSDSLPPDPLGKPFNIPYTFLLFLFFLFPLEFWTCEGHPYSIERDWAAHRNSITILDDYGRNHFISF